MARFDRQAEKPKDSKSLDLATGNLQSFVEDKVREILEAAVSRAEQIEREAIEWAAGTRQEAERKSAALIEQAFTRAWRILDGIDLLENGVGDMIAALRAEMEGFAADLGSAAAPDDRPVAREPAAGSVLTPGENAPAPRSIPNVAENGSSQPAGDHVEVEQMIIEQVAELHRQGRPRAEAERLVMRFKQGQDYLHVIDRIY
jgi:hypothetical protein